MNVVVLFFGALHALSGPGAEQPRMYPSLEACEAVRSKIPEIIAEHNASDNPDKILAFTAVCTPMERAKQGKEV